MLDQTMVAPLQIAVAALWALRKGSAADRKTRKRRQHPKAVAVGSHSSTQKPWQSNSTLHPQ